MPDDFSAGPNTAGRVAVGGTLAGNIETVGDVDWIAFDVPVHAGYSLSVTTGTTGGIAHPQFTIWDGTAVIDPFAEYSETAGAATMDFWNMTRGRYYIRVSNNDLQSGAQTGAYTVSYALADDHPNGPGETLATLVPGQTLDGTIDGYNDVDLFTLDLVAGNRYLFNADVPNTSTLHFAFAYLTGGTITGWPNGSQFYSGTTGVVISSDTTGAHTLRVSPPAGATGDYQLQLRDLAGDLPEDVTTTATMQVGQTISGTIDYDFDRDWYAIDLQAGHTYEYTMAMPSQVSGGSFYPGDALIRDASGMVVDQYFDPSFSLINIRTFVPSASGTYFVDAHNIAPGYAYDYTLSVTEVVDDFPASVQSTGTLAVGGSATGTINATGDRDWFAVTVSAGSIYRFDVTTNVPELAVGLGAHVAQPTSSEQYFRATQDGTIWVEATSWSGVGDYTVSATQIYQASAEEAARAQAGTVYVIPSSSFGGTGLQSMDVMTALPGENVILRGMSGADTLLASTGDDILVGDDGQSGAETVAETAILYRAYKLLLGREPDATGMQAFQALPWVVSVGQKIQMILNSPEFVNAHGQLSNQELVDFLYTQMRGPGGAGSDPAVAEMVNLFNTYSEIGNAIMVFSESTEWRVHLAGADANYVFRNAPASFSQDVFSMYHALLGRDPDAAGFADWALEMSRGLDLGGMAQRFLDSAEFAGAGALDDRSFAAQVLTALTGAAPAVADLDRAETVLAGPVSRADWVAANVLLSPVSGLDSWIAGQPVDDVLIGNGGRDILMGGMWSDVFVFDPAADGLQRIGDFEAWDLIDLRPFGYADAATALAQFQQQGDALVFADAGVTVVVEDTTAAELTAANLLV